MIQHFHGRGKEECWRGKRRMDLKVNGEFTIFYVCGTQLLKD